MEQSQWQFLGKRSLGSAVSVGETYIACPFPVTAEKVLS